MHLYPSFFACLSHLKVFIHMSILLTHNPTDEESLSFSLSLLQFLHRSTLRALKLHSRFIRSVLLSFCFEILSLLLFLLWMSICLCTFFAYIIVIIIVLMIFLIFNSQYMMIHRWVPFKDRACMDLSHSMIVQMIKRCRWREKILFLHVNHRYCFVQCLNLN